MSIIQCHVDYASTIWLSSITQSLRDKFQTTQNKITRFVLNLDPRSRIENEHFAKLGWLPFFKKKKELILLLSAMSSIYMLILHLLTCMRTLLL